MVSAKSTFSSDVLMQPMSDNPLPVYLNYRSLCVCVCVCVYLSQVVGANSTECGRHVKLRDRSTVSGAEAPCTAGWISCSGWSTHKGRPQDLAEYGRRFLDTTSEVSSGVLMSHLRDFVLQSSGFCRARIWHFEAKREGVYNLFIKLLSKSTLTSVWNRSR